MGRRWMVVFVCSIAATSCASSSLPGPALVLDLHASADLFTKVDPSTGRLPGPMRDARLTVEVRPTGWSWAERPRWQRQRPRSSGLINTWIIARGWYRAPGRYHVKLGLEPGGQSKAAELQVGDDAIELRLRYIAGDQAGDPPRLRHLLLVRRSLPAVRLIREWRYGRPGRRFYRLRNHSQQTLRGTGINGALSGRIQRHDKGRWIDVRGVPEGLCGNQPGNPPLRPGKSKRVFEEFGPGQIPGDLEPGRYRFVLHYATVDRATLRRQMQRHPAGRWTSWRPATEVHQLVDEFSVAKR